MFKLIGLWIVAMAITVVGGVSTTHHSVKQYEAATFFSQINATKPINIVMVSADWCGACKKYKKILSEIVWADDVGVVIADMDSAMGKYLVDTYRIRSIPQFFVYVDGQFHHVEFEALLQYEKGGK